MAVGPPPSDAAVMVVETVKLVVSITATPEEYATYALVPSALKLAPKGFPPIFTVPTTVSVVGSITDTVPLVLLVTKT